MMAAIRGKLPWALVAGLGLLLLAALSGVVRSGPLDPPAPPGSTLPQVEPRAPVPPVGWNGTFPITIGEPGSYFLTGDIELGSAQPEAVLITASDVTLDLNGFTIESANFGSGIVASGSLTRITIRNGSVVRALSQAVNLGSAVQSVLEDLKVQQNLAGWAVTAGEAATVRDVTVWATVGSGISLGPVADVDGCTIDGFGNANTGTIGLLVGVHSSVARCSVAYFQTGVEAGPISRISDCVARFESTGVMTGDTSTVERCTVSDAGYRGIDVGVASRVSDCDVRNGGTGVAAGAGSTVENCTVGSMTTYGITVAGNGVVQGNHVDTVTTPGGVKSCGVSLDGGTNRADGNFVINSQYGMCLSSFGGDSVTRNVFRNNTFNISSFLGVNDIGPVGTAATATQPWSNIAY